MALWGRWLSHCECCQWQWFCLSCASPTLQLQCVGLPSSEGTWSRYVPFWHTGAVQVKNEAVCHKSYIGRPEEFHHYFGTYSISSGAFNNPLCLFHPTTHRVTGSSDSPVGIPKCFFYTKYRVNNSSTEHCADANLRPLVSPRGCEVYATVLCVWILSEAGILSSSFSSLIWINLIVIPPEQRNGRKRLLQG